MEILGRYGMTHVKGATAGAVSPAREEAYAGRTGGVDERQVDRETEVRDQAYENSVTPGAGERGRF